MKRSNTPIPAEGARPARDVRIPDRVVRSLGWDTPAERRAERVGAVCDRWVDQEGAADSAAADAGRGTRRRSTFADRGRVVVVLVFLTAL